MVEAAAPHPEGLLLACRLLEQLEEGGQKLKEGYYSQLIRGNANAADLRSALAALNSGGARSGGGWRVSDAAIATLMESLGAGEDEASRESSLQRLRGHGVKPDRKISDYLGMGGRRSRASKFDNANDVIAATERGSRKRSTAKGADLFAGLSQEALWLDSHTPASAQPEALGADAKQQYAELDRLLSLRDDPQPKGSRQGPGGNGEPPKKDTKRTVPGHRLQNLRKNRLQ